MQIFMIMLAVVMAERSAFADASQDYIEEIKNRYMASVGNAKAACSDIADKINKVKVVAGISTGVGALGTLSGGMALTTGIIKAYKDKKIAQLNSMKPEEVYDYAVALEKDISAIETEKIKLKKDSQSLGLARTIGNFVAGGTGAGIAIASLAGTKNFNALIDEIVADMAGCNAAIAEIEKEKLELQFVAPEDALTTQMAGIIDSCKGMNPAKIIKLKDNYKAAGITSAIGGAAGIAGGATSVIAGNKEKTGASAMQSGTDGGTKGLNLAANIGAGVATAGNGISTGFSIAALVALKDNGDIAGKCKASF